MADDTGKELGQNILAAARPDGKETLVVAQMFLNFVGHFLISVMMRSG